jgi:tRNA A37 threonylcarbamoyladenosine biosynthesis protein TsaE
MVHEGPVSLVHLDLYRFGEEDIAPLGTAALESLGLEHDELLGPDRVLVVEWASLWGEPPPERLEIRLDRAAGRPKLRNLDVTAAGDRCPRLLEEWMDKAAKNGLIPPV